MSSWFFDRNKSQESAPTGGSFAHLWIGLFQKQNNNNKKKIWFTLQFHLKWRKAEDDDSCNEGE